MASSPTAYRWLPESVYSYPSGCQSSYKASTEVQDFDLATPDGQITACERVDRSTMTATVVIANISSHFRGFEHPPVPEMSIDDVTACQSGTESESGTPLLGPEESKDQLTERVRCAFILKSSLTQLALNVDDSATSILLDDANSSATVTLKIVAVTSLGVLALDHLDTGAYVGRIFAPDSRRKVTDKMYLDRLLKVKDANGFKVLCYDDGACDEFEESLVKMVDGRLVLMLPVKKGVVKYQSNIHTLLPTIGEALKKKTLYKELLGLHQTPMDDFTRVCPPGDILMVRAVHLSMRTMFGRVVDELLPDGLKCASSSVIEPISGRQDVEPSDAKLQAGRTFVFVGHSSEELTHIPVELFTNECFREYVPFETRKSLTAKADSTRHMVKAFKTMPKGRKMSGNGTPADPCCTFICKGGMFRCINSHDWITTCPVKDDDYKENTDQGALQEMATRYARQQSEFTILNALAAGDITSEGLLLCRYFPSPIIKSLILSRDVRSKLKRIYFTQASRAYGGFLSEKDQTMLIDLAVFGIRVFFVELQANNGKGEMYEYIRRPHTSTGQFVPMDMRHRFPNATFFGVYGSNLVEGDFESELQHVMQGVVELAKTSNHPLLNPDKPIALVTGGGPGAMEVGNRVAKSLGILSCGMFVDFGALARKPGSNINEQKKNPYVEAFMTYRPDKLVERQSDFNLHFPIFLTGGIGTDFEYALEEVRRKVGTVDITPIVCFGSQASIAAKIGSRFQENLKTGVIKNSEWLSNVPYVVSTGAQALAVYQKFADGSLPCGGKHPSNTAGYMVIDPETLEPVHPPSSSVIKSE